MKGGADLFVENLPGFPDNIRPSSSGGYWLSMATIRPNPGFSVLDFLSERPYIKRMIFKVSENYNSKNQKEDTSNYDLFLTFMTLEIVVLLIIIPLVTF